MSNFRIYNESLCPDLWDEYLHLNPKIRVNLLRLASDFYKNIKIPVTIDDVYLMGSIANYNWTPNSDIDVHIMINFNNLKMPNESASKIIRTISNQWNQEHTIEMKGHKVEMNFQDSNETKPHVTGIYSLFKDQWIRQPTKQNIDIDKNVIQAKYQGMQKYIESVINSGDEKTMLDAKKYIDAFRQYGLDTAGEMSYENIVFKILRAKGLITKLKDSITNVYDKEMTITDIKHTDIKSRHPQRHQFNPVTKTFDFDKLTLDNLKALRDKVGRTIKYLQNHPEFPNASQEIKNALDEWVQYNDEIKRRMEIINKPITEATNKANIYVGFLNKDTFNVTAYPITPETNKSHYELNPEKLLDDKHSTWRYNKNKNTVYWWESPSEFEKDAIDNWVKTRFNMAHPNHELIVVHGQSFIDSHELVEKLQDKIPETGPYIIIGMTFPNGHSYSGITTTGDGHSSLQLDEPSDDLDLFMKVLWWRYKSVDSTLYLSSYNSKSKKMMREISPIIIDYIQKKYNIIPLKIVTNQSDYLSKAHSIGNQGGSMEEGYGMGDPTKDPKAVGRWTVKFDSSSKILKESLDNPEIDKNLFVGYIEPENFNVQGASAYTIGKYYPQKTHGFFNSVLNKNLQWGYDALPWRYRIDNKTLYWWDEIPAGPYKEEVENWISKKLHSDVKQHIVIDPNGESGLISHGLKERYGGAKQEISIWYHGTSAKRIPLIMSQGLNPNVPVKHKSWDSDSDTSIHSPDRSSYGGIYVSKSLMTAKSAAYRTAQKDKTNRAIVITELQPRSLVADEDDFMNKLIALFDFNVTSYHAIWPYFWEIFGKSSGEQGKEIKNKWVDTALNRIIHNYPDIDINLKNRLREILFNIGYLAMLTRLVSYIKPNSSDSDWWRWREAYANIHKLKKYGDEEDIPNPPTPQHGEKVYREFIDQITKTFKHYLRSGNLLPYHVTARSLEPIRFTGRNKIIAIIEIVPQGFRDSVKVVYGTLPEDFKKQWTQSVGNLTLV